MWILRFGKLQSKDYNKITRLIKKSGFHTRRIPDIIYAKALVIHTLQKRSLRNIAQELSVSHIGLHKFFISIKKTPEYSKIFHVFLEARATLYVEDTRYFTQDDLDNSEQIYSLTENSINSILKS